MEREDYSPEHQYETVYKIIREVRPASTASDMKQSQPKPPVPPPNSKPALPPKLNLGAASRTQRPFVTIPPPTNKTMSQSMNEKIRLFTRPATVFGPNPVERIFNFIPFTGKSVSLPTTPIKNMVNLWKHEDEIQIAPKNKLPYQVFAETKVSPDRKTVLSPTDNKKDLPARPPRNFKKSRDNILVEVGIERDDTGAIVYVTKDQLKPLPRLNRLARQRAGSDSEDHLRSVTSGLFSRGTPKTRSLGRGIVPQFSRFSSISSLDSEASDSAFREMSGSNSTSAFGSSEFHSELLKSKPAVPPKPVGPKPGTVAPKPIAPPRRRGRSGDRASRGSSVSTSPVVFKTVQNSVETAVPVYAQIDKTKKLKNREKDISKLITKFEIGRGTNSTEDLTVTSGDTPADREGVPGEILPSSPAGENKSSGTESDIESNIRKIENSFASISAVLDDVRTSQSAEPVSSPSADNGQVASKTSFSRLVVGGSVVRSTDRSFARTAFRRSRETFSDVKTFFTDIQQKPASNEKEASPAPSTLSQDSLSNSSDTKRFDDSGSQADISDMTDSENCKSVRERIASIIATVGNGVVSNRLSKKNRSPLPKSESSAEETDIKVKKKFRTLPRMKSAKKMDEVTSLKQSDANKVEDTVQSVSLSTDLRLSGENQLEKIAIVPPVTLKPDSTDHSETPAALEPNRDNNSETKMILPSIDSKLIDPARLGVMQSGNPRDSSGSGENHSVVYSDSEPECKPEPDILTEEEKRKRKAKHIASEIVSSENVFVDCLKLLNDDYRKHILNVNKEEKFMPETDLAKFLSDLPQLLKFSTVLLSDLQARLEKWDTDPKIADIIARVGPFLKLYSVYIRDFEYHCALFDEFRSKYSRFDQLTIEFEKSGKCRMLGLKHYMLKPVQRIPQYRMLLQDYLGQLDESSIDYEHTHQALKIVIDVADHANNSVKQEDNFHCLLKLQSRLGNYELIRSGRLIRKEGELQKLSRKTLQPRYFILLNDCLLYTSYQGSPPSCKLRVNHELPLVGMKVDVPTTSDYPNEFIVISTTRSLTLIACSIEERDEWLKLLRDGIRDAKTKRQELAAWRKDIGNELDVEQQNVQQLGKHAPIWIPDSRVTMCQLCCSSFSVTFRRHHCRACGKVICTSCSGNQAPLEYLNDKKKRVCDDCYLKLADVDIGEDAVSISEIDDGDEMKYYTLKMRKNNLPSRLVEVAAKDSGSQMNGYLWRRSRHSWKRFWFVLKDRVLYIYRASEDVAALETSPVLGYRVQVPTESLDGVEPNLIFKLTHLQEQQTSSKSDRTVIFHAEDPAWAKKWIAALSEATVL